MGRPLGIVLIAILAVLVGAMGVVASVGFLRSPSWALQGLGLALLALGGLCFASACGLWTFQRWGWRLAIWLAFVSLPLTFVLRAALAIPLGAAQLFAIGMAVVLAVAVVVYLLRPDVRYRFPESTG
jgi:hypothetical protein